MFLLTSVSYRVNDLSLRPLKLFLHAHISRLGKVQMLLLWGVCTSAILSVAVVSYAVTLAAPHSFLGVSRELKGLRG